MKNLHKFCVWSGVIMMALFTIATLMARLFPPPSPTESAAQVVDYFLAHLTRTRIGLITGVWACAFMGLFIAATSWEGRKMTGRQSLVSHVQLVLGTLFVAAIFFPFLIFQAATFRPERPIDITQGINDIGWLIFVPPVSVSVLQLLVLAIAMLNDKRSVPTFPRWFAYYTIFTALDFALGGFCVLTKVGPFAWNGVLSFYIPFVTLAIWFVGMAIFMAKSVEREYVSVTNVFDDMPTEERVDALSADVRALQALVAQSRTSLPSDPVTN